MNGYQTVGTIHTNVSLNWKDSKVASSFEQDYNVEKIDFENVAMDSQILLVIKRISYLNALLPVYFLRIIK